MANALYNEIEPFACGWLDNLVNAGHIAPGRVERRSITDLTPDDVAGPGQRHFFAGIGGWSYALRLAGIPDNADVWTGSCPCQPFSDAGKGLGVRDPRHLWPAWFALIRECRPPIIFGEQVASRVGLAWFDVVRADLEGCGYAVGASDLCAASVGAPHIRQRLYFVAYASGERREGERLRVQPGESRQAGPEVGGAARLARSAEQLGNSSSSRSGRDSRGLPDAETSGPDKGSGVGREPDEPVDAGAADALAVAFARQVVSRSPSATRPDTQGATEWGEGAVDDQRSGGRHALADRHRDGLEVATSARSSGTRGGEPRRSGAHDGWKEVIWLPCLDGKARPIEPGLEPLAHGVSKGLVAVRSGETEHLYNRAGALAGFGNAIVPELAATFIRAALEAREAVTP